MQKKNVGGKTKKNALNILRFMYLAAGVKHHVPLDPSLHEVPLPIGHIVTQVSLIAGIH